MEYHCARTFLIAEELAQRGGQDVDREVMLCAAWLHDAGLYPGAATKDTYVKDGRRLAERTLAGRGWPPARLTRLGDAIEYHHELRSQWARGNEVELMRRADLVEVSQTLVRFGLPGDWLRDLRQRISPTGMVAEIGRLLARAARDRPGTLPRIFTA